MWMKIRLGWLVVGISTVVIGFLAGQWPFALVAIVVTWLVDGVLRVKARGMLPDDEPEWNGLTDWLKRFGQALVQHRSVAYLILMATMIVHYMRPFDVVLGLLVRVGVMVAIEVAMAYVAEEKEVRKAQGRRPTRRKQPRVDSAGADAARTGLARRQQPYAVRQRQAQRQQAQRQQAQNHKQ